jgi:hypothetical protein
MSESTAESNEESALLLIEKMLCHLVSELELERNTALEKLASEQAALLDLRNRYDMLVAEARTRWSEEDEACNHIISSQLYPLLDRIRTVAEEHALYPKTPYATGKRFSELPPDRPFSLFNHTEYPDYHPHPSIPDYLKTVTEVLPSNIDLDRVEKALQTEADRVGSYHCFRICGIKWGYIEPNPFPSTTQECVICGLQIRVFHDGEVELLPKRFLLSQLTNNEFVQELVDAFCLPMFFETQTVYVQNNENGTINSFRSLLHRFRAFWRKLWDAPQESARTDATLLTKLWYGFPAKDIDADN